MAFTKPMQLGFLQYFFFFFFLNDGNKLILSDILTEKENSGRLKITITKTEQQQHRNNFWPVCMYLFFFLLL